MGSQTKEVLLLAFLLVLGISAMLLSIVLLGKGKLYYRLRPDARPRRWVLMSVLFLFGVFVLWFPIWISWPHALVSRLLTLLFGLTLFVVSISIRWGTPLIDRYIKHKGWPLR